jgi:hypothetical protein
VNSIIISSQTRPKANWYGWRNKNQQQNSIKIGSYQIPVGFWSRPNLSSKVSEFAVLTDLLEIKVSFPFSAWFFEVWVDRERLLSRLSLTQAIGSFLHLAFVFQLEYPKVNQFLFFSSSGSILLK